MSVALVGFAPAPFPRPERGRGDDRTDVAGTWAIARFEVRGRRQDRTEELLLVRMTRQRFTYVHKKSGQEDGYHLRLDPAASPPAVSLLCERVELVGSYRLRGDELTMMLTEQQRLDRRPTDFAAATDLRIVLRRLRRD